MPHQPPSILEKSNEHRRQDLAIQRRILNGITAYRARLAEAFTDIRSRGKVVVTGKRGGPKESEKGHKGATKEDKGAVPRAPCRDIGKDLALHGGRPRITFCDKAESREPLLPLGDSRQPEDVASDVPALERPHSLPVCAHSIKDRRTGQPAPHPAKIRAKLQGQDPASPVSFFVPPEYEFFFECTRLCSTPKHGRKVTGNQ